MGELPRVSVIVPTFDRRESISRTIDAIADQTYPQDRIQVVVADDASTDGTVEALTARSDAFDLVVLPSTTNRGPGAARNAALGAATGEILAFTDSDCVPTPTWLEAGVERLRSVGAAIVQGRTLPERPADGWARSQLIDEFTGRFETCNIFYRRADVLAVGGFDETLGFFGEDLVLGYDVLERGVEVVFEPDAMVHHEVQDDDFVGILRRTRYYRNWPALVRRHPRIRRDLLWHRWFLRRRSAEIDLAVAGLLAAAVARRPVFVLAAAPYLRGRAPMVRQPGGLAELGRLILFDLAVAGALVEGSIRTRSLVV